MKIDPAYCIHSNIGKSVKIETISIPELGIEQLVLRVRVFCKDCKEAFMPKTMNEGFSTGEIGIVGDELFVPLVEPQVDDLNVPDEVQMHADKAEKDSKPPPKEFLH